MPFTLAHAAAAWPFRRTRLDICAFIAGCFAPDFGYAVFVAPYALYGHTLPGLFVFDLPAGLLVLWLFHDYVKEPATIFLPKGIRERLEFSEKRFSLWPPARLALTALSILMGALTHIVWDSLTHEHYWPYRRWQALRLKVQLPVAGNVEVCKLLQYGSTLLGITVIAIWVWQWRRGSEPVDQPIPEPFTVAQKRMLIVALPMMAVLGAVLRAYAGVALPAATRSAMQYPGNMVISASAILWVELLACGIVLRKREASRVPA